MIKTIMHPSRDIARLLEIMAALRTPGTGCPWDLEQDFRSIVPYTIEEAHEVADAIERDDMGDLCEELGDLLLQVVFHARMAEEQGAFDFGDVVDAITRKMIRRHPHVFGDQRARTSGMAKGMWERIKAEEKAERRARRAAAGMQDEGEAAHLLNDVPGTLPALAQAMKLQAVASRVGFDWNDASLVLDKIEEEIGELRGAIAADRTASSDAERRTELEAELGDILFAAVNLARHLQIDPDAALRRTNTKFRTRFGHIEDELARLGRSPKDASLDEMEALWQAAKSGVTKRVTQDPPSRDQ